MNNTQNTALEGSTLVNREYFMQDVHNDIIIQNEIITGYLAFIKGRAANIGELAFLSTHAKHLTDALETLTVIRNYKRG